MGVWHVARVFDDAPWARLKTIDNFGIVCARHPNCHHARCLDRVSGKLLASACMAPVKVECRLTGDARPRFLNHYALLEEQVRRARSDDGRL